MNEPIINPWIFYWLDVLCSLKMVLIALLIPGLAGILVFGINYCEKLDNYERDEECEFYAKRLKRATKTLIRCVIFVLVTIVALIFLPSREAVVKMFVAQQITRQNLNIAGETVDKLIDKAVEKIVKVRKEK